MPTETELSSYFELLFAQCTDEQREIAIAYLQKEESANMRYILELAKKERPF